MELFMELRPKNPVNFGHFRLAPQPHVRRERHHKTDTAPVNVFSSETINAIAIAPGFALSPEGIASYTITPVTFSVADSS